MIEEQLDFGFRLDPIPPPEPVWIGKTLYRYDDSTELGFVMENGVIVEVFGKQAFGSKEGS